MLAKRNPLNLWLHRLCAILIVAVAVAGCASDDETDTYVERPVADLYNQAMDDLASGNYSLAAEGFDEVERQHPYSVWATKAQLMSAYSYYLADKYDESVVAAERFIQLHPGHDDVAYAYYLLGLDYYERISDVGRDQGMTENALSSFQELIRRFPQSKYARDARLKIDLARDHLAGKEMEVGRTYQQLGFYLAAINRFRTVVEKFQTTSHVPEALHRLTESYLALGVQPEAQAAAAVLGHNFPGSSWYEDSYSLLKERNLRPATEGGSWLADLIPDWFKGDEDLREIRTGDETAALPPEDMAAEGTGESVTQ
ncbi:MAG: outer membrane protein assembly factor BamD [Rhodospirillaceae bacterium]|jgi:outer membrane protein assembly factor BamD|nr:outer membrane protein assembly factor BamD [Rhodospirillaceae bacterium]